MNLTVNDEEVEVEDGITVTALLQRLDFPQRGIAVAVDWAVLP
ncbi:MAG TPA: thiamine biosynthesis protein ThiS, partial [Mycobacterium sp.]|nr:thiamine biosynthesis protein ThiS [Mycobacterium sp.]